MMAVRHAGLMPPELAVEVFEFAGLHFGMDDDAIAHVDRLPGGQGKRGVGELRIEVREDVEVSGQCGAVIHIGRIDAGPEEGLAGDAFEAFERQGDPFDKDVAKRLHDEIMCVGNSVDPGEAYRRFRGRDPEIDALLRARGFN